MKLIWKQCPKCGSKNTVKIVYGYPSYKTFQKYEAGKIRLGGCCVVDGSPEYFCRDCENEWNRAQVIDAAYNKLRTITASVGGYFGECYDVEIDFADLRVSWKCSGNGVRVKETRKRISISAKEHFIEQLIKTDILNWKAKYEDLEILDGTDWSVEINTDGKNIRKYGINRFPETWDLFCKLISETAGEKFQ